MFILIDGLDDSHNKDLAINLNSANKIVIRFVDGLFTIMLEKMDTRGSNQVIIANFRTKQDAIGCFEIMMKAYQQGCLVWEAPKSLS
jgi:hypothetical protein